MESKRPNHRPNKPLTTNQELTDDFYTINEVSKLLKLHHTTVPTKHKPIDDVKKPVTKGKRQSVLKELIFEINSDTTYHAPYNNDNAPGNKHKKSARHDPSPICYSSIGIRANDRGKKSNNSSHLITPPAKRAATAAPAAARKPRICLSLKETPK